MPIDEAAVRDAWDRNAPSWVERVRSGRDLYREVFNNPSFLEFLPSLAGLKVLDLGCGEGTNTRLLAATGADVTGIDLSHEMIAAARAEEALRPLGISYEVGSFTNLDFIPDASFDAAVSTMAMMDGPDFDSAAREIYRLVKPGGSFTFSVLHPCFITPAVRWEKNERGEESGLVVGNYFDESAFVERWRFSRDPDGVTSRPFEVPRFPRRLETYTGDLLRAGFQITGLKEPRPSARMVEVHPWLKRWREHAAIFLYLSVVKPMAQG